MDIVMRGMIRDGPGFFVEKAMGGENRSVPFCSVSTPWPRAILSEADTRTKECCLVALVTASTDVLMCSSVRSSAETYLWDAFIMTVVASELSVC